MARVNNTFWHRNKYLLNALILVLPGIFFYQSLHPVFPPALAVQSLGEYEITAMPYDLEQPYTYNGVHLKDFFVIFNKGNVANIRQAYLNVGHQPLPIQELQTKSVGILHGSRHGKEVHALTVETISPSDKVWLTVQNWQGDTQILSWDNAGKAIVNNN